MPPVLVIAAERLTFCIEQNFSRCHNRSLLLHHWHILFPCIKSESLFHRLRARSSDLNVNHNITITRSQTPFLYKDNSIAVVSPIGVFFIQKESWSPLVFLATKYLFNQKVITVAIISTVYVTGFWKTVPNHTFLFQYIYHCNMKSIALPIIFHSTTRNSMLKLLKECKKYSVNTYS